jgi:hypothetical protein
MSQSSSAEDMGSPEKKVIREYQITLSETIWRDLDAFNLLLGTTNGAVIKMIFRFGLMLLAIEYGNSKKQITLEEDGERYEMSLYSGYDGFDPPDGYITRTFPISMPEILWQELDAYGCFRGITTETVLNIFFGAGLKIMQSEFRDNGTRVILEEDGESYILTLLKAED